MTQSSLEMLGKESHFFMCRYALFAQKISLNIKTSKLCLVFLETLLGFSRDLREVQTLWS